MKNPNNIEAVVITVKSPAKINLTLQIVSKRKDGYHNLETIMLPVSLYDELQFRNFDNKKIKIISSNRQLPVNKENIISRAIRLLWEKTGEERGVAVRLKKIIPIAAGLGGGSSNAASTLIALNKLWNLKLSADELSKLGARLGADVPFFIHSKPALAKGIGEKIHPFKIKNGFWIVLLNPGFPVSTAWVYKNFNLALTKKIKNNNKIISFLEKGVSPVQWSRYLWNDLESVTLQRFPILLEIKNLLIENGALKTLMSGSGPTVFGVFASKEKALKAYNILKRKALGSIFLVNNL